MAAEQDTPLPSETGACHPLEINAAWADKTIATLDEFVAFYRKSTGYNGPEEHAPMGIVDATAWAIKATASYDWHRDKFRVSELFVGLLRALARLGLITAKSNDGYKTFVQTIFTVKDVELITNSLGGLELGNMEQTLRFPELAFARVTRHMQEAKASLEATAAKVDTALKQESSRAQKVLQSRLIRQLRGVSDATGRGE
jgi:hypothetical protein